MAQRTPLYQDTTTGLAKGVASGDTYLNLGTAAYINVSNSIASDIPQLDASPASGQSQMTLVGTTSRGNYAANTVAADASGQSCGTFAWYGGPSTVSSSETRIALFSADTAGSTVGGRSGTWRISLKSDGTSGTLSNALMVSGIAVTPGADNVASSGSATLRWSQVFANSALINISDARLKTPITPLTDQELAASKSLAVELGTYQFLAAIAAKGATVARLHIGMTVQRVIEIMSSNGLDAMRYGLVCHDIWEAQDAYTDDTGIFHAAIAAGDVYSFRGEELLLFIARGFDARLTALESK